METAGMTDEEKHSKLFFTRGAEYKWLGGRRFKHKMLMQHEWHEFDASWSDMINTSMSCPVCDRLSPSPGLIHRLKKALGRVLHKRAKDMTIRSVKMPLSFRGRSFSVRAAKFELDGQTVMVVYLDARFYENHTVETARAKAIRAAAARDTRKRYVFVSYRDFHNLNHVLTRELNAIFGPAREGRRTRKEGKGE